MTNCQDSTHSNIPKAEDHTTAQLVVIGDTLAGSSVWPSLLDLWKEVNAFSADRVECIEYPGTDEDLSIEDARAIGEQLVYGVARERFRHVVIHHAHTASVPAQQALLKMLEDGRERTQWWLLVSAETALLPTIRSRCQIQDIRKILTESDIKTLEQEVAGQMRVDSDVVAALVTSAKSLRPGEIVDLSQQYTNRLTVRQTLKVALTHLHDTATSTATKDHISDAGQLAEWARSLQKTLECLEMLDANVSPRMVFEHWLFCLSSASHQMSTRGVPTLAGKRGV